MKKVIFFLSFALIAILILAGCASANAVTSPTSSTVSSPTQSPTNSPPPMTTWVPVGTPSPTVFPTSTTALTLEEAQAQFKSLGWAAVDTAGKASQLAGYPVATPTFLPEGFIPRVWANSGIFMVNKVGFGATPTRDFPLEVDQYFSENPDPKAPKGPYFLLSQSPAMSGMLGGTLEDIDIGGYAGKKSLMPAQDNSPARLALHWSNGTVYYILEGQLSGPLDEATLIKVAESMKFNSNTATIATFPDAKLEAAIRDAISKPQGPLYISDLEQITRLDVRQQGVTDITGLEKCVNLQELMLIGNQIQDISPLSSLTGLTTLMLSSNQVQDISALASLKNLEVLDVSDNKITDFSLLAALPKLTDFAAASCQISNISFISGLPQLTTIDLTMNQITDISPVANLHNLKSLMLMGNIISDLSPLAGLTGMITLNLNFNKITDISSLSGLINLQQLDLLGAPESNRIEDISALKSMNALRNLHVTNNRISDISPIASLPSLKTVAIIGGNPLSSESIDITNQLKARGVQVY